MGSCYSRLPYDGWDFDAIVASRTDCTRSHILEVFSVFSVPPVSGSSDRQDSLRRLYILTSCADQVVRSIGLTSSASHYALEVETPTGEIKGVCAVVTFGSKPDTPILTSVPYAQADLSKPLCMTSLAGFVACTSRRASLRADAAALFYPLTSITSGKAFPGRKSTTRRANRIAKELDHPSRYHYFAPRTPGLWESNVRMVFVYHRR